MTWIHVIYLFRDSRNCVRATALIRVHQTSLFRNSLTLRFRRCTFLVPASSSQFEGLSAAHSFLNGNQIQVIQQCLFELVVESG